MIGRLKFFAAAALGLVLATGTLADVSAKTATHQMHARTQTTTKIAQKSHRLHTASLRRAHKLHVAKVGTASAHRDRHAMNHRMTKKPASVIR